MPGNINIEATINVFTGRPLVVVITTGDTPEVIGTEVNLSPDEADELAKKLIISAEIARVKVQ